MPPKRRKQQQDGGDTLSARELAREYGFGWKFFKSDPELWDLLQQAVKENWTDSRFVARFKATKWYKKNSEIYRQNYALKFTDPATYRERLGDMIDLVDNLGEQWGAQLNEKEVRRYATRAFLLGWDESQILDTIAKEVRPDHGSYGGELSGIEARLREVAHNNGVGIGPKQLKGWMRQIVRGEADVREFETYIRKVAAQTFTAYGEEIKAGMNAIDVASPYIQSMADILEMNPNSIGLDDRTIRQAMSFKNDKGEAVPMSITDFEDSLRRDKRWQYTDQARQQMQGYAIELGKMWGVLS